ncbi:lipoprotein [Spiroplasma alleghenense]|uniref:Lipoprotein n=1 Tax=Spiroplasma alleghenense TaxID=216931 RepID=A0A345Z4G8_9MOLU|nr:lipoprotein [Spiroplasma alleghenense]AXK51497.1 hypothetical protein SALLE_v1c08270 [Spiroplasma alleghenense]
MKKLLLILGGLTLTASTTASVVACNTREKSESLLDFPSADYRYLTEMYKNEIETYLMTQGLDSLMNNYVLISDDNESQESDFKFLNYAYLEDNFSNKQDPIDEQNAEFLMDLSQLINIKEIRNYIISNINSKIEYRTIKPDVEETKIFFSVDNTKVKKVNNAFAIEFSLIFSFNYLEESGFAETTDQIELSQSIAVFNTAGKPAALSLAAEFQDVRNKMQKPDLIFNENNTNPNLWENQSKQSLKEAFKTKLSLTSDKFDFHLNSMSYLTLSQRIIHSSTQRKELVEILKSGEADGDKLKSFYDQMSSDSKGKTSLFGFNNFENSIDQKFGGLFKKDDLKLDSKKTNAFGRMNVSGIIVNDGGSEFVLPEISTFYIQQTTSSNIETYQKELLDAVAKFFNSLYHQKPESENTFLEIKKPDDVEFSKKYTYNDLFGKILGEEPVQEAMEDLDKFGIQPSFNLNQMSLKQHNSFYVDANGNIYALEGDNIISEINWGLRLFLSTDFNGANSIALIQDYVPKSGEATQFKLAE